MTQWEPPHENLPITQREIENIINTAKKNGRAIKLFKLDLYNYVRNESLYNGQVAYHGTKFLGGSEEECSNRNFL